MMHTRVFEIKRTIYILKISLISHYKMFENIFIGRFSYCSRMYLCDVFLNSAYDRFVFFFINRKTDNFTTLVAAMNRFLLLDNTG